MDNAQAPPPTGTNGPAINLQVKLILTQAYCPPWMQCLNVLDTWVHEVTWSSTHPAMCSGVVEKTMNGYYSGGEALSGESGRQVYVADGTAYHISLTCAGDGWELTEEASAGGVGGGGSDI